MTRVPGYLLDLARLADQRCDAAYTRDVASMIQRCLPVEHQADVQQRRALLVQALTGFRTRRSTVNE